MTRTEQELLHEAIAHLELARDHAENHDNLDQLAIDAVCMHRSAGIEVLARLDGSTRQRLFGANSTLMWGMRNRIAHGYLLVDSSIVSQTVATDLPDIIRAISVELCGEG